MRMRYLFAGIVFLLSPPQLTLAGSYPNDASQLQKYNPDGEKYEFVKDYLTSLSYLKINAKRSTSAVAVGFEDLNSTDKIKVSIDILVQENANLRVARNFLKGYKNNPQNGLIIKVTDLFEAMCDEQIDFNKREINLYKQLYESLDKSSKSNKKLEYKNEELALAEERRESFKKLLEASMLVNKVLISDRVNEDGKMVLLGVTREERKKLLKKLDAFYEDEYKGNLRAGQSFLQGSVSVIRELLENSDGYALDS